MSKLYINTDGGSRGNPGPAAIGIVFCDESEKVLYSHKEFIGEGKTNNEAEYTALIRAFEILPKSKWFSDHDGNGGEVICRLDSQLVVEQVNGNYKIKQEHLKILLERIKTLYQTYHLKISFIHIPREDNKLADKLVNEALDETLQMKNKNDG
ncbi:MAG TPA: ribonuclease HI family protein [bacterium]|nr:ribonuclease HI family protein [bacterium]